MGPASSWFALPVQPPPWTDPLPDLRCLQTRQVGDKSYQLEGERPDTRNALGAHALGLSGHHVPVVTELGETCVQIRQQGLERPQELQGGQGLQEAWSQPPGFVPVAGTVQSRQEETRSTSPPRCTGSERAQEAPRQGAGALKAASYLGSGN